MMFFMGVGADVPGVGHIRAAYLDTSNLMGVVVEVIEMG
jgi:hypothetical protein